MTLLLVDRTSKTYSNRNIRNIDYTDDERPTTSKSNRPKETVSQTEQSYLRDQQRAQPQESHDLTEKTSQASDLDATNYPQSRRSTGPRDSNTDSSVDPTAKRSQTEASFLRDKKKLQEKLRNEQERREQGKQYDDSEEGTDDSEDPTKQNLKMQDSTEESEGIQPTQPQAKRTSVLKSDNMAYPTQFRKQQPEPEEPLCVCEDTETTTSTPEPTTTTTETGGTTESETEPSSADPCKCKSETTSGTATATTTTTSSSKGSRKKCQCSRCQQAAAPSGTSELESSEYTAETETESCPCSKNQETGSSSGSKKTTTPTMSTEEEEDYSEETTSSCRCGRKKPPPTTTTKEQPRRKFKCTETTSTDQPTSEETDRTQTSEECRCDSDNAGVLILSEKDLKLQRGLKQKYPTAAKAAAAPAPAAPAQRKTPSKRRVSLSTDDEQYFSCESDTDVDCSCRKPTQSTLRSVSTSGPTCLISSGTAGTFGTIGTTGTTGTMGTIGTAGTLATRSDPNTQSVDNWQSVISSERGKDRWAKTCSERRSSQTITTMLYSNLGSDNVCGCPRSETDESSDPDRPKDPSKKKDKKKGKSPCGVCNLSSSQDESSQVYCPCESSTEVCTECDAKHRNENGSDATVASNPNPCGVCGIAKDDASPCDVCGKDVDKSKETPCGVCGKAASKTPCDVCAAPDYDVCAAKQAAAARGTESSEAVISCFCSTQSMTCNEDPDATCETPQTRKARCIRLLNDLTDIGDTCGPFAVDRPIKMKQLFNEMTLLFSGEAQKQQLEQQQQQQQQQEQQQKDAPTVDSAGEENEERNRAKRQRKAELNKCMKKMQEYLETCFGIKEPKRRPGPKVTELYGLERDPNFVYIPDADDDDAICWPIEEDCGCEELALMGMGLEECLCNEPEKHGEICNCCHCRGDRQEQCKAVVNTIQNAMYDPTTEMKYFIDSMIFDLSVMEQVLHAKDAKPKKEKPSTAVTKPMDSYPVRITDVTNLGPTSLYVVWECEDCAGVAGYEIYVDGHLTNRLYSPLHQAVVVCDVNVNVPHQIVLRAHPMEEDYPGDSCACVPKRDSAHQPQKQPTADRGPGSSRPWSPSVYLYEPL